MRHFVTAQEDLGSEEDAVATTDYSGDDDEHRNTSGDEVEGSVSVPLPALFSLFKLTLGLKYPQPDVSQVELTQVQTSITVGSSHDRGRKKKKAGLGVSIFSTSAQLFH